MTHRKSLDFAEFGTKVVELCEVLFMCHMKFTLFVECTVHMRHWKYAKSHDFTEFDVEIVELCKVLFMFLYENRGIV